MARDRSRDYLFLNCNQEHELNYVAGLYTDKDKVYAFSKLCCSNGLIKYSSHKMIYDLIKDKLGLEIPG